MNNVNFARSFLILLVVLGHSVIFWTGSWILNDIAIQSHILGHIANWLNSFHTQALTAISGFTYEYIFENKGGYVFSDLLSKKIKRLLIPYLLVSLLWILPLTSFIVDIDSNYLITKFVLGKSPAQLWYLLMLFNVFMLFFPLRFLLEKSNYLYLFFPILYFVGSVYSDISYNYFQFFTSLRYLSFFMLGHLMYKNRRFFFSNNYCNLRQPCCLFIMVILHIAAYILYINDIPGTKTLLMLYLNFGGTLTAVGCLLFIGEKVNHNSKLISILNNNSFAVYLIHQQIIYFTLFYLNGVMCPGLHALINFVVSLSLSLLLSITLHKSKIIRVYFLGEKN